MGCPGVRPACSAQSASSGRLVGSAGSVPVSAAAASIAVIAAVSAAAPAPASAWLASCPATSKEKIGCGRERTGEIWGTWTRRAKRLGSWFQGSTGH